MEVHDNVGVQVGDGNTQYLQLPPAAPVTWPVRVGVLPPVADRYQHRAAEAELSGKSAVLSGLGGVGKSQLAARHAHAVWRDESVDLVVWIAAVTRVAVISAYADAAGRVLRDAGGTPEDAAAAFQTWLSSTDRRWLVVLDDVQDPADLKGLWPPSSPTGQVVVTTRRRDAALSRDDRRLVEVGVFTEAESLAYLTAKLPGHDQLPALADDLGHLPLALAQAAAFIADKPLLTVADYRKRLADRRSLAQVLPTEGELPDEHRATVAATWSLSIERADALRPEGLARPLLEIISLLDPAGTPVAVLTAGNVLASLVVDADDVHDALGCLHRLSLITLDTGTIQAHALLQRAVRDTIGPSRITPLAHLAADALLLTWPGYEANSALAGSLRSAAAALHRNTAPALWEPRGHAILIHAGRSTGEAGLYTDAIDYFRELRRQAEHHLGPDHEDSLNARNEIATWSGRAGRHDEAVAEDERLVADTTRVLGPDDVNTLAARSNRAHWRAEAGDQAGAIAELERILSHRIEVLGPDHQHTLGTRHNLAGWRAAAGDHAGAIAEFERVVADHVRALGPDHPQTLTARYNLAAWRGMAGEHGRVVGEFGRLVVDRGRVLGVDHPDTLMTRFNLALARLKSGDLATALVETRELLADHVRVLGPDHPDTVIIGRAVREWSDLAQDGLEGQLGGADELGVTTEGRGDDPGAADRA
ncbi:tetratricopeptide repeat protein [Saccharothrix luteola]|uniref:tetratricopeptide repeat protein n=1 Tax=Saccharothrix luteola TaxID=2893018 RepID=UPI001E2A603A|nr:tetratricopeptide repeat protein [Saccharothrix luteola]MCC8244535.1 tetratricopeptide repeat protein [Saccharothrix luteola]